uniref:Uncharacterized protein n=1 Tax=Anguilla anguilla TaxID=7936 RepID=A0A0E9XGQ7_ANGAN
MGMVGSAPVERLLTIVLGNRVMLYSLKGCGICKPASFSFINQIRCLFSSLSSVT